MTNELIGVIEDDSFNVKVQIMESGPKGDKGDIGEQGPQGNDGYTPIKGIDYFDGEKGDKGEQGERGPQGPTGKSTEYNWNGTELGVRVEGESSYQYVNLRGPQGAKGDTGEKGTDANYVHDQISSAKGWRIIHSLGKYPSVTIVDSGGNVVVGDIKYVSTDEIEISFSFEFSGKAYLN